MGTEEVNKIMNVFSQLEIKADYIEHKPVITSEDAAKTRGFELKQGIKALLFTNGKNDWVIVCIPADKKADTKKVALFLSWLRKEIRMATPEEVLAETGCEVGAVPPFGHKNKIKIIVDKEIYFNEESVFNIGLRTKSAKVKTIDMKKVFLNEKSEEGDFIKDN